MRRSTRDPTAAVARSSCLLAEDHRRASSTRSVIFTSEPSARQAGPGLHRHRVDTRREARRWTQCYCKDPSDSPPARQLARFTAAVVLHRAIVSRRDFQLLIFRQCPHQLVRPLSLSHGHIAPTATPTSEAWSTPTTPSTGHAHVPTRFRQS